MTQVYYELKLQKEKAKAKKKIVQNTASNLHNKFLETYFDENCDSLDVKRSNIDQKYDPANLMLDDYECCKWYQEK